MMDLSYACIPNSDGNLIRVCREPFIYGYLETYKDGLKNTCGKGTLGVERIKLVRDDENYPPVFFMGVGSYDFEEESNIRFIHELTHQKMIGGIMCNDSEHFFDTPNHLS